MFIPDTLIVPFANDKKGKKKLTKTNFKLAELMTFVSDKNTNSMTYLLR